VTRNPCDVKETADKILDEFVAIAELLHIQYFLAFGTCLGMVRDGGYIQGDGDIDVGVFCTELELKKLTRTLVRYGFKVYQDHSVNRHFHKNQVCLDVWYKWHTQPFPRKLGKIVYNNKTYSLPYHRDEYLTTCYGNWRVPKTKPV